MFKLGGDVKQYLEDHTPIQLSGVREIKQTKKRNLRNIRQITLGS